MGEKILTESANSTGEVITSGNSSNSNIKIESNSNKIDNSGKKITLGTVPDIYRRGLINRLLHRKNVPDLILGVVLPQFGDQM